MKPTLAKHDQAHNQQMFHTKQCDSIYKNMKVDIYITF